MSIHRFMQLMFIVLGAMLGAFLGFGVSETLFGALSAPGEKVSVDPGTKWRMAAAGMVLGIFLGHLLYLALSALAHRLEETEPDEKLAIGLGVIAGALITFLLNPLFVAFNPKLGWALTLVALVIIVYISCVSLMSMKDYLPITAQMSRKSRGTKVLDTNVIIDGRIYDIMRTGFLEGRIYVPGFVLDELQHIADSTDPLKRARGRRGLDVLKRLQQDFTLEIKNQDRLAPHMGDAVDARLVRLAKAMHADIVTNDFNLNRVAELQEVRVMNINELAEAVRIHVLPGEELVLAIIREGKEEGQGIAYLEDGTMVVVEGGKSHISETIRVAVTSVLQSSQGKMVFARPMEGEPEADDINQGSFRAYTGGRKRRPLR